MENGALEAYLNGEKPKGYTVLLTHIRQVGLRAIIAGSERDLDMLKKLAKRQND